jgi:isopentenyl-diphosphate delta-isomerase type 1
MAEEMLDIVDDNDNVIGREGRSVAHARGLQHRGVHVFLFMPDGRLLVQHRNRLRKAAPSTLDCSVSEHVQSGEEYLAAAQRGLHEELGLKGIPIQAVVTFRMQYGPNDNEISRIFQGQLDDPRRVHFDPGEVDSVDYVSLPDLERQMQSRVGSLSPWFEQFILWNAGRPNAMQVLATHGPLQPTPR